MIHYARKGLWERKARTGLTLIGIAVCVLALTTLNGNLPFCGKRCTTTVDPVSQEVVWPSTPMTNWLPAPAVGGGRS
jgi:hypothetical protein